jgi:uncharacterized protein (TIGR02271 family)
MTDLNPPDGQQPDHVPDPNVVVTRSEEELRITTHRRETQRARLIKYVETETQTTTVEVRHERARVEYEPISEDVRQEPPAAGSASSDDRWLVLYDEEVVVQTRWVARERVRLATQSVIEDREISEDVRREQFDADMTRHMEDDDG